MIVKTNFSVTEDLVAFLDTDGADYSGLLVVRSERHDDYDTYRLDENNEWAISFDSLSNKLEDLEKIWDNEEFIKWSESIKPFAKNT